MRPITAPWERGWPRPPKLYFTDTGLAAYLLGFGSAEALWASRQAGPLWENHVIGQWLRWRAWHEPSLNLWYWRDQGVNEVDLVLERNHKLYPVECKLAERPDAKALQGIRKIRDFYGPEQVERAYVACPISSPYEVAPGVTAVSGWMTWAVE